MTSESSAVEPGSGATKCRFPSWLVRLLIGTALALLGIGPTWAKPLADRVAGAMRSTGAVWICVGPSAPVCSEGRHSPEGQWKKAGAAVKIGPGLAATAAHVLVNEKPILALRVVPDVGGPSVTEYGAMIASQDEMHDIAILTVTGLPGSSATLGVGADLRLGAEVFFIGHPSPMVGPAVGTGIVSALEARWVVDGWERSFFGLDASINHGNSGGGVFLRSNGRLIGIVNAKAGSLSQKLTAFRDAKPQARIVVSGLDPVDTLQQTLREMQDNLHLGLGAFAGVQHLRALLDRTKTAEPRR